MPEPKDAYEFDQATEKFANKLGLDKKGPMSEARWYPMRTSQLTLRSTVHR
ncbi:hypothetical protein ACFYOD_19600 [Streptomyces sp. NPDC006703]|uniref:hypothetical protein n=1 Tax=Streptomyces sp. NPDC006703 TaxID=3364759 RepID=UPI0036A20866